MPIFQVPSSDASDRPESQIDRSKIEDLQGIADGIAALLCELRPEFGHLRGEAHTLGFLRTDDSSWKGLSEPQALSLEDTLAKLATEKPSDSYGS